MGVVIDRELLAGPLKAEDRLVRVLSDLRLREEGFILFFILVGQLQGDDERSKLFKSNTV